jgi:hypothetical protein
LYDLIEILDVDVMLTHIRGFLECGRVAEMGIVVLHMRELIFVVVPGGTLFTLSGSGESAKFIE